MRRRRGGAAVREEPRRFLSGRPAGRTSGPWEEARREDQRRRAPVPPEVMRVWIRRRFALGPEEVDERLCSVQG